MSGVARIGIHCVGGNPLVFCSSRSLPFTFCDRCSVQFPVVDEHAGHTLSVSVERCNIVEMDFDLIISSRVKG